MRFKDNVTIWAGILLMIMSLPFVIWEVYETIVNHALLTILILFSVFMCLGLFAFIIGLNRTYAVDNEKIEYMFFNKKIIIKKDDILVIKSTNTKISSIYIIPNTISIDYLMKIKPRMGLIKDSLLKRKGCICMTETKKVIKCLNDFGYSYDKNDLI